MADAEQLAILEKGVAIWNDWRDAKRSMLKPDLFEANLRGIDLREAHSTEQTLQSGP